MALLLLFVTAIISSSQAQAPENCTDCYDLRCPEGGCYFHCPAKEFCPEGHFFYPNETKYCGEPDKTRQSDDPITPASTPTAGVTAATLLPTTTTTTTAAAQTTLNSTTLGPALYSCYKCQVDNCSVCNHDNWVTGCDVCKNGTQRVVENGTSSRCEWKAPINPGGGGDDREDGGGGGSSQNTIAIAAGVAGACLLVLVVVGAVVFILWRRNSDGSGGSMLQELGIRKRKSNCSSHADGDDEGGSNPRYTKSPTRSQPSYHTEESEINNLGEAPAPPPENYEGLDFKRVSTVQYGHLEFKDNIQGEDVYNNQVEIEKQNNPEDGPTEIYNNDEANDIGPPQQQQQQYYIDMTHGNQAQHPEPTEPEDQIYNNDPDPTPPPNGGIINPAAQFEEDDEVYLNEVPPADVGGHRVVEDGGVYGNVVEEDDQVYLNN